MDRLLIAATGLIVALGAVSLLVRDGYDHLTLLLGLVGLFFVALVTGRVR